LRPCGAWPRRAGRWSCCWPPTPPAWFEAAAGNIGMLLVDHANCEKKAASTAVALLFAYPDDPALTQALSRLAREELRHFEQVQKLQVELGVPFARQRPGRYAEGLRKVVSAEPRAGPTPGPDDLRGADRGAFLRALRGLVAAPR
jgi:tRNA isopentenyl-2-thiomethyl-A-37 hydroxylase MiaE